MRAAVLVTGALMSVAASALTLSACRGIVGGDEADYKNVVDSFCECWQSYNGIFARKEECTAVVEQRLAATEGKVLADWLTKYVNECSGQCKDAVPCYYTMPVCSFASCSKDEECCSYDGGVGTCNDKGECAPLGP